MSMRRPSSTSPLPMLRTSPSSRRVSSHTPGAPPGSARSAYSLARSWRRIGHAQADLADELPGAIDRVVGIGHGHGRTDREDRRAAARRVAQVQAQRLLLVDLAGQRRRQLAELRARIDQVVVLEAQQPGDRAAAQFLLLQQPHEAAVGQAQRRARGIVRVHLHRQRLHLRAQHQALAAGDEHRQAAVVGLHRAQLQLLAQVGQRLVALVEQVVRRMAQAQHRGDALVQLGNAARPAG